MLDSSGGSPARLHYLSGSYRVVTHGDYVVCATTGERIALNQLKYWNAERQEAYVSAEAATIRHLQLARQA